MPICSVQVPFGDEIIADLEVDYEIGDDEMVADDIGVECAGFYVGHVTGRIYQQFTAKAGPEAALRDRFAEAADSIWHGRIVDACQKHAERNKTVNRFARGTA